MPGSNVHITNHEGIRGPQGPAGLVWRGMWEAGTAYAINDAVQHNGSAYIAIAASTGQEPPNATYWSLLAAKGDQGAPASTSFVGAFRRLTTTHLVPNFQIITFNQLDFDTHGFFTSGARATIPASMGNNRIYRFFAHLLWDAHASGHRQQILLKNGTEFLRSSVEGAGTLVSTHWSVPLKLNVGEYVEVQGHENAGSFNATLQPGSYFGVELLGDAP